MNRWSVAARSLITSPIKPPLEASTLYLAAGVTYSGLSGIVLRFPTIQFRGRSGCTELSRISILDSRPPAIVLPTASIGAVFLIFSCRATPADQEGVNSGPSAHKETRKCFISNDFLYTSPSPSFLRPVWLPAEHEAKILYSARGDGTILVSGCGQIADRCFVQAGPCWLPYESGAFPKADYEPWIEAVDSLVARGLIKMCLLLGRTPQICYEVRNKLLELSCILPENYIYLP